MARLESQIKAGYYKTPVEIVELICSFVQVERPGTRIIDPCCGTGEALAKIAHGLQLQVKTYGIEMDKKRAAQARQSLTKVVNSDLFRVRTKAGAYSLLFLNPPYDNSDDEAKRLEHKFLVETNKYLGADGVLVYIIPQTRLTKKTARYLAGWYRQFSVYRFPGKSYDAFHQIVLFAVKKPKSFPDDTEYARLTAIPETILQELHAKEDPVYTIPGNTIDDKAFYLRSLDLDMEEVQKEVDDHGAWGIAKQMMCPSFMGDVRSKVLMPLRRGHLATLMAAGLCDGLLEKNGKRLLIKGVAKKEQVVTEEHSGDTVIEKATDIIKIGIKALDLTSGEVLNIE